LEDPDSDPNLFIIQLLASIFTGQFNIGVLISIIVILILLAFSALISGSEIAFFALNPFQLKEFEAKDTKNSRLVLSLLKGPKRLLASILIANNFVNVSIVILSAYVTAVFLNFSSFPVLGIIIEIFVITFIILLFGEIMPKIFANQKPDLFASFMARPLNFIIKLFYPIASLLVKTTSLIDKKIAAQSLEISMTDISEAIDLTVQTNDATDDETKILKGIVKFTDIEVSEIMKSRMDVIAIDIDSNFHEVIQIVTETGYSRIPVFTETFDNNSYWGIMGSKYR